VNQAFNRDVFITGLGVRTAFGSGTDPIMDNVFTGKPGFRTITMFDTAGFRTDQAAYGERPPRQSSALQDCAAQALEQAGITAPRYGATLLGSAGDHCPVTDFWTHANGTAAASLSRGEPDCIAPLADSLPAHQVEALADACEIRGPRLAFVNGCVASSNAIIHGCRLISSGRVDFALCAGGYLVEREFFAKFDSGRAFASDGRMRPFSAGRSGLLLGDAVAAVVLESAERINRRGGRPLARISGWGMASDAYHVCQPHPGGRGMTAAIQQAMKMRPEAGIDYINAHGTATPLNDAAETLAIKQAFGGAGAGIPVSSTKGSTGHTLEASGVLETVICLLALAHQVIPPTGGFLGPDPDCDLDYVTDGPREQPLSHVLSLNSAFGGANTALLLSRP